MMNSIVLHSSASSLRRGPTEYKAEIIHFYTLTYQDLRQKDTSRLSIDQLERNLVPGEAAADEEVPSNGSTVTAKAQIQKCATAELSIVESAPTEIINKILNNLLEEDFPDICSALCFGLTSRRNWTILRNLDHTSYLKEHMDHIPSIIDFKYDKIPLFNPYHEKAGSNSVVEEINENEFTFKHQSFHHLFPRFFKSSPIVKRSLSPSQRKQIVLFKEWMGPKYRPPTSLLIPCYLSCAVYGESDEESIEEEILEGRFYDFIMAQAMMCNSRNPFGLGDIWDAIVNSNWDY
ncbi:hypothetical protein EAE99_012125 [Botrytis elliptica]|nr:hypothetical protein EAE99_012125 [Botrytis elliptica]